jgi:MerR family transcriptional regulator, thiopeptide resistance regulator
MTDEATDPGACRYPEDTMRREAWKVGELARRTGLTVRALHHYDEIGLLRPSLRTESGHRLYTAGDVARLQRVLSLRQLGLSLEEVRDCLDRNGFAPLDVLRLHVARLRERIAIERRLCDRLEAIAARLEAEEEVSADTFIHTIQEMTMIEGYYTAEQLDQIKKRGEELGPEAIQRSQEDWAELIAEVRGEMDQGTDPSDPRVQDLARRWMSLIEAFTGGDPGIAGSLGRLWKEQGDTIAAAHDSRYDPRGVMEYIGRAMAAARETPGRAGPG